MVAKFHPPKPIPADPLGQRLHALFGRQLWDFIEAPAAAAGEKPQWRTVSHYPLRPRVLWQRWQDPDQLIGVRFNSQTSYGLLDIDAGSPYCNSEAIAQLNAALETIGITRTVLLRSSFSNGLHLYLPLPELVKTFDLAVALHECLKAQGFTLAPGTLETFPNPKPYGVEKIIHYTGHRLPLQPGTGSCLLDNALNPIDDQLDRFFWIWEGAASHQAMEELHQALKVGRDNHRKRPRRLLSPGNSLVDRWREDLQLELAEGWSGPGQTNHLLKTIACYGHVFLGLAGEELLTHTLETATHLPGYGQHCRHQPEIVRRVQAWCKAVENYYWPLGDEPQRDTPLGQPPSPSVNQQRAEAARDRIASAMTSLKQLGSLPSKIRDLAQRIAQTAHCSLATVYKHLNLWHPAHTAPASDRPAARCVTVEPPTVSAPSEPVIPPQPVPSPAPPESPDPLSEGLLHTLERSMKCVAVSLEKEIPPERGVRGEFPQGGYPQVARTRVLDDISQGRPYVPLPPPPPTATAKEWGLYRNQEALRQCRFQLQWSREQFRQYVAEQFGGKRFYQLLTEEVVLLIYKLRSLLLEEREASRENLESSPCP